MFEELKEKARQLPTGPGVYLMKDDRRSIIYVGKAVSLRKRVVSYFTGSRDIKTRILVSRIKTIEHIVTRNEYEALLLENNLIKRWKPRYNINLKDGKSYPVIRVTSDDFPRVFRTRRIVQDGSSYYGPFPSVVTLDNYLELIEKLFPLRKCKGELKKREAPCLYYHIGRCSAPCVGKISKEGYQEKVELVKKLLSGETEELMGRLKRDMREASEELRFEKAAEYRDAIDAIESIGREQEVVDFDPEVRDYVGFAQKEELGTFIVFQMRAGKLLGRDLFRTVVYTSVEEVFF
jgi:excinuclease ABC subunit C